MTEKKDTIQTPIQNSEQPSRPPLRPETNDGKTIVTPEMRKLAEELAHPQGDPYLNGRRLGFYCEQCG